jgi:general nucleoside transport system permease protein
MSTTVTSPRTDEQPPAAPFKRMPAWARFMILAAITMLMLSISAEFADAPDLTSSGAFGAALRLAVPIGLAGLGGLYSERAGVVNIGLEGMMTMGTWFAGWAGWHWGPWAALAFGAIGGMLGGALHALATVTFGVNHIVSGVAINILAVGLTRYLAEQVFAGVPGASASLSPPVSGSLPRFSLPFLSGGWGTTDIFGWLEDQDWFFVSDVAGLLKGLTSNLSAATVIAVLLVPLTAYLLWRTAFGLRLRSCGEKPSAADSLGVPVYRMKYIAVLISGSLAGLGGATLVLEANRFREGQTANRGFLGLAALIFGNWRPGGVAAGSGLFGYASALELRSSESVRALILFAALTLMLAALFMLYRRRNHSALILGLFAVLAFMAYTSTPEWLFDTWLYEPDSLKVDTRIVFMTPYIVTLLVLAFASQRLRMPAADGLVWRKGDAT